MAAQPTKPPAADWSDPQWAWSPYQPDESRPWDLALAGHLFRRAGFGADWHQLQQAVSDGPQRAVDRLLRPEGDVGAFNRAFDEHEASLARSESPQGPQAWWLRRMIQSPHMLLEKMTLFWHGHFAISSAKVKSSSLLSDNIGQLRSHALGDYAALLAAMTRDPAVLVSVGADENRKARPSEPYARQLLAWCGVGPEQMSPRDVHEVARALTGWFVLRGEIRFIEREHDPGVKKILGHEGPFQGEDVVRIVLQQQTAPRLVVRKLYRWLISETADPGGGLLAPLVEAFSSDYDIGKLVETMLRSKLFFSPLAYRQRVKSPVEFAMGIIRPLGSVLPTVPLGGHLAMLGQDLGNPPTTNGWEGGRYWINKTTLVARDSLALALLSGAGAYGNGLDPAAVARKHRRDETAAAGQFLLDLLLQNDLSAEVRGKLLAMLDETGGDWSQRLRCFVHALVVQPEFQLA